MSSPNIFKTINLVIPIKDVEGKELKSLDVRRAKAKDLQRAQKFKTEWEQEAHIFSLVTGLQLEDIAELDLADYTQLQDVFMEMRGGKSASAK